jgi:long-chain acyl-CoA synthetase
MLAHHFVYAMAERRPDKTALIDGDRRLSYGALADAARRLAGTLQARGVGRGERVLLLLPNGADLVISILAVLDAGAAFVPVHPQTKAPKLAYLLRDTEAAAIIAHASTAASFSRAVAEAGAGLRLLVLAGHASGEVPTGVNTLGFDEATAGQDRVRDQGSIDLDLAAIIYTSGTTGQPKGVMLSHRNMVSATRSVSGYLPLVEDDVIACALPMCFSYGLYQPLLAAHAGATVLIESGFTFPMRVLEDIQRERATVLPAVPAVYATLLGLPNLERFDLSRLRLMTNAAAALPVATLQEITRRFPAVRFYSMYGQTECKRITYLDPEQVSQRPASVGRGMPNQELFLSDGAGQLVRAQAGQASGELVVRGSHVMMGYWRKPDETALKLRDGVYPGEKVLHTGDLFRTDSDGYLYFVARQDDIIKSRGEKVSPREVEDVLHELPGVVLAAVIGIPDPLLGEAVKAFIVAAPDAHLVEKEVMKHCLARLENYMVPKVVSFVPALPMTNSGKVNKSELKSGQWVAG